MHFARCCNNNGAWAALASHAYLCEYPVLSVVLLQDVLEGELDLLLELLHLHLLLEPRSVCSANCHIFSDASMRRNETAPLNWKSELEGAAFVLVNVCLPFSPSLFELWLTPTSRHQHKGGEQGDLILRQVHRTQVFPKLEDGADQVVTACHSKGQRERA